MGVAGAPRGGTFWDVQHPVRRVCSRCSWWGLQGHAVGETENAGAGVGVAGRSEDTSGEDGEVVGVPAAGLALRGRDVERAVGRKLIAC